MSTATVVEHKKFSCTNLGKNNNKYWNVTLYDNGDVFSEWGRQGHSARTQSKTWPGAGRSFMDKKIREKEKKGYRENKVAEGTGTVEATTRKVKGSVKDIALKQIRHKSTTAQKLIAYLDKVNAHQIVEMTGGMITYDTANAQFRTTQGVVLPDQIQRARELLSDLSDWVHEGDWETEEFEESLNEYLSLIPRDFGRQRMSPEDILPNVTKCQQENALLDGLEASFAGLTKPSKKKKKTAAKDEPKVFDVELTVVEDKKVISWVRNFYQSTRKSMHTSNNLSVKAVYTVEIANMKAAFDAYGAKMKDIRQLWHGTQASNVLSILRQGLIIPKSSSAHCTGRMYGDGIYASSISTKALNYATSFWGGGNSERTFMFILDMAMGKYHLASGGWGRYPVRGTDSTWAKGGRSGVINDEMIVYRLDQCNLTHLVEFEPRSRY